MGALNWSWRNIFSIGIKILLWTSTPGGCHFKIWCSRCICLVSSMCLIHFSIAVHNLLLFFLSWFLLFSLSPKNWCSARKKVGMKWNARQTSLPWAHSLTNRLSAISKPARLLPLLARAGIPAQPSPPQPCQTCQPIVVFFFSKNKSCMHIYSSACWQISRCVEWRPGKRKLHWLET